MDTEKNDIHVAFYVGQMTFLTGFVAPIPHTFSVQHLDELFHSKSPTAANATELSNRRGKRTE